MKSLLRRNEARAAQQSPLTGRAGSPDTSVEGEGTAACRETSAEPRVGIATTMEAELSPTYVLLCTLLVQLLVVHVLCFTHRSQEEQGTPPAMAGNNGAPSLETDSKASAGPTPPPSFCCPISMDIMADPVIIATGHTYDRVCIERWLQSGNKTCPVTGMRLRHHELTPNFALRTAIHVCWGVVVHISSHPPILLQHHPITTTGMGCRTQCVH